jgi:DNA invertase Pin-like site-specific DNA recombinase
LRISRQRLTILKEQGISFKSLTENIDTSTATGNLVFQIFGALAEFERNLIKERTVAGLEAARVRGRKGGRPRHNPNSDRVAFAKRLYRESKMSIPDLLKTLNISKSTLYRWLDIDGGNR